MAPRILRLHRPARLFRTAEERRSARAEIVRAYVECGGVAGLASARFGVSPSGFIQRARAAGVYLPALRIAYRWAAFGDYTKLDGLAKEYGIEPVRRGTIPPHKALALRKAKADRHN